ncbi:MAG: PilZ domain-containing protein [Terriglobia bacterium]
MSQPSSLTTQDWSRRSERALLRIPIRVEGADSDGRLRFREDTYTLMISRNGALIRLNHSVGSNDQIRIINLQSQLSCPFRVVAQTSDSLSDESECVVECLESIVNFWGILFPETLTAPAAERVDALLECSICHDRELASLALDVYRSLVARSSLTRPCPKCGVAREWRFGFADAQTGDARASQRLASGAPSPQPERRRAARTTVKLPVRTRKEPGGEQVVKSENLSKTGVCFICDKLMAVGEIIRLTLACSPAENETEVHARVVWRRPLQSQRRVVYGVHLEALAA